MDGDRLKALTERADRAKKLAADIAAVQKADYRGNYLILAGNRDGRYPVMTDQTLLEAIFDLGKAKLLADLEAELSSILEPLTLGEALAKVESVQWTQPNIGSIVSLFDDRVAE